jgi:outer membrane protein assembly factor BamE (lipoprotein component of BamABCDE complex)
MQAPKAAEYTAPPPYFKWNTRMTTQRLFFLLPALLWLGACAPTVETRGNLISDIRYKMVTPQVSTRADVEQQWGPPTTVSTLDPNTWYYIGETTERQGIKAAKVVKRRMVRVRFDAADMVTELADLDPRAARPIEPVDRKTATAGKEYTMFQQFIGNLGKFNSDKTKSK